MKEEATSDRHFTVAHFMPWNGMGGVEIATLRLVEATYRQFRHIAFCLPGAAELRGAFEKLGVATVIYSPPVPSLRHAGRFYKESRVVARQIREVGAEIVHFADERAANHNSLAALLANARMVCHLRVSYPTLDWRHRACLLPVHSFIFVSREARQSFALPLPAAKTCVIYDAIEVPSVPAAEDNNSVRRELGVPDGCVLVGMVARVSRQKDYFTLADAAVRVLARHPDARFLIVGDNSIVDLNRSHYAEVAERLQQLGIADRFIFTGHRTDVPRLIAAMDLCVLCTHREGFPLGLLETMAMGKPVVATSVGGIPEIVNPGVTGYLHRHGSSAELADAILHLVENPEEAARIGGAAREYVRQNCTLRKFTAEIAKVYSDVMRLQWDNG